jgi:hypothetical protein
VDLHVGLKVGEEPKNEDFINDFLKTDQATVAFPRPSYPSFILKAYREQTKKIRFMKRSCY